MPKWVYDLLLSELLSELKLVSSILDHHPTTYHALGKASHSPAHGRRRMAALCYGTQRISFMNMND